MKDEPVTYDGVTFINPLEKVYTENSSYISSEYVWFKVKDATANFGSELGSQAEQVSMAMSGDLEMVVAAPGTGPGAYEGCEPLLLFEFPFLFKDNDQYRRVMKAVLPEVNAMVGDLGFTAMGGQSQGARDILTTKQVSTIDDMKDLVMRGPNAVYISMFESVGAAGITMDWNDIYSAMQNKTCDGCEGSRTGQTVSDCTWLW